jgi:hypothetical protein
MLDITKMIISPDTGSDKYKRPGILGLQSAKGLSRQEKRKEGRKKGRKSQKKEGRKEERKNKIVGKQAGKQVGRKERRKGREKLFIQYCMFIWYPVSQAANQVASQEDNHWIGCYSL